MLNATNFLPDLVDPAAWQRAGFVALAFGAGATPFLGFVFADQAAGEAIFRSWLAQVGRADRDDLLRISIIRSRDPRDGYALHLSTELSAAVTVALRASDVLDIDVSRGLGRYVRHFPTRDHQNLDDFLAAYRRVGIYAILPYSLGDDALARDCALGKRALCVRDASEIDPDDPDDPDAGVWERCQAR